MSAGRVDSGKPGNVSSSVAPVVPDVSGDDVVSGGAAVTGESVSTDVSGFVVLFLSRSDVGFVSLGATIFVSGSSGLVVFEHPAKSREARISVIRRAEVFL